jgi:putative transposase
MPWRETCVMEERMAFVVEWQRGEMTMSDLCRHFGVSRKTGYQLIERFTADGVDGLKDRSRAPRHHPNAVPDDVVSAVVNLRRRYPSWGPKKIKARLRRADPATAWPAESTIGVILDRQGLVVHRRRHRHMAVPSTLSPCGAANDVWGIDFKGWFRTGDGRRCDPLSLSDLHSRYVLRLQAVERCDEPTIWPLLDAAFREYGPPRRMRSDNGPPFAGTGVGGLSRLSVKLIKLGITPERIAPGKPQQNGRHERLHLTVQQETASPPAANRRAQQRRFDAFRRVFNEERPHEALGQDVPAAHYHPQPRTYIGRLREPEYPAETDVRRVRHNGEIKWRGELVFISQALAGEPVALTPTAIDGRWLIAYGPLQLAIIDPAGKLHRLPTQPQPKPPG